MTILADRKKADQLTPEEALELEAIGEFDRIFTHINALLMAQTKATPAERLLSELEPELECMAQHPEIQRELAAINHEFASD